MVISPQTRGEGYCTVLLEPSFHYQVAANRQIERETKRDALTNLPPFCPTPKALAPGRRPNLGQQVTDQRYSPASAR